MRISSRYLALTAAGLLVILFLALPTQYYCMMPGKVWDLAEMVEGGAYTGAGKFHMTTVSLVKATPVLYLYGQLHPSVNLMRRKEVIPEGWTEEEYSSYSRYLMQQSHNNAKLAVAQTVDLPYHESSQGAYILRVEAAGAADGILQPRDVIVNLNGQKIEFADELVAAIQRSQPGEEVTMIVNRQGEEVVCQVVLGEDCGQPGKPLLGVGPVFNHNWQVKLEPDIVISTGSIAGPSAGLMLALELLNRVTPRDLTQGLRIAGTGTLDADGRVGKIGGIVQKLRTAEKANIDVFLLPYENWLEIKDKPIARSRMNLIPVSSLTEALSQLHLLEQKQTSGYNWRCGVIQTTPALATAWVS